MTFTRPRVIRAPSHVRATVVEPKTWVSPDPDTGGATSTRLRARTEAPPAEHPLYYDRNGGFR